MSVNGVKKIQRAIRKHQHKTAEGLRRGLYKGGLFLQRESQIIVPRDTGDLAESANTRLEGSGFQVAAIVSYRTDYALFVHEDLEARHTPGKQAKFLEQPLREKRDRIAAIVRGEMGR